MLLVSSYFALSSSNPFPTSSIASLSSPLPGGLFPVSRGLREPNDDDEEYDDIPSNAAAAAATAAAGAAVGLDEDDPHTLVLPGGDRLPVNHGTTTLAFIIDEGIVCAVDSRASMGSLVGSRTTDKVLPVTSRVLGTMAGGAADCGYWIRALSAQVRLWELEEGRPASVASVAHLLVEMLRGQRGLSVGTMIMGHSWTGDDKGKEAREREGTAEKEEEGGEGGGGGADRGRGVPGLYYVDSAGTCMEGSCFAVGSGSQYAISVVDAEWKKDMGWDAASDLAVRALQRATHRDAFSGGFLNVYHVTRRDGWRQVRRLDSAALPAPPG